MDRNTTAWLVILAAAIPTAIFQAWAFMTIYNVFIPLTFGLPPITSIWYVAGLHLLVNFFKPIAYTGDLDKDERLKRGCVGAVAGLLMPIFALAFAWVYMQLGGIS